MKIFKKLIMVMVLLSTITSAYAKDLSDEDVRAIWTPGRYTLINYASQQTAVENETVLKSSFSMAIGKGAVYYFPKKPLWGCVKFGADVRWMDMSFAKYKDPFKQYSDQWGELGTAFDELASLGTYTVQVSALGIGPNIGVAPFSFSGNKRLRPLRLGLYFHYNPTFGAYIASNDGETEVSWGYCNMMDFGARITYRKFHLGVECRWGSGKFKPIDFEKLLDDEEDEPSFNPNENSIAEKITRKFAATRFYVGFSF